jgi:hypothetical protein
VLAPYQGFLLSDGNYTTFDVPGSAQTLPGGINNHGQIVGEYDVGDISHDFLLIDGVYSTIDVPGAVDTFAEGINNLGQIVGYYVDGCERQRSRLLATPTVAPVPEPSALLLLVNGTCGVIGWAWWRRGH